MEPTLPEIAEVIRQSEADIIALQEVDVNCPRSDHTDQPSALALATKKEHYFFKLLDWESTISGYEKSGQYGLACLLGRKLEVEKTENHVLPQLKESSEARGYSRICFRWNGIRIDLVNTHLSTQRNERNMQIDALIDGIENFSDPGDARVLVGDFNIPTRSRALQRLRRLGTESQASQAPRYTYPARFPIFRLDRVFISGALRPTKTEVIATPMAKAASDHLPLSVFVTA